MQPIVFCFQCFPRALKKKKKKKKKMKKKKKKIGKMAAGAWRRRLEGASRERAGASEVHRRLALPTRVHGGLEAATVETEMKENRVNEQNIGRARNSLRPWKNALASGREGSGTGITVAGIFSSHYFSYLFFFTFVLLFSGVRTHNNNNKNSNNGATFSFKFLLF